MSGFAALEVLVGHLRIAWSGLRAEEERWVGEKQQAAAARLPAADHIAPDDPAVAVLVLSIFDFDPEKSSLEVASWKPATLQPVLTSRL